MTYIDLDKLTSLTSSRTSVYEAETNAAVVKKAIAYGKQYAKMLKQEDIKKLIAKQNEAAADGELYHSKAYQQIKSTLKQDKSIKFAGEGGYRGTFIFSGNVVLKLQHFVDDNSTLSELNDMKKFPELRCFPTLYAGDMSDGLWMVTEACAEYNEAEAVKLLEMTDAKYNEYYVDSILEYVSYSINTISKHNLLKSKDIEKDLSQLRRSSYNELNGRIEFCPDLSEKILKHKTMPFVVLNDLAKYAISRHKIFVDIYTSRNWAFSLRNGKLCLICIDFSI